MNLTLVKFLHRYSVRFGHGCLQNNSLFYTEIPEYCRKDVILSCCLYTQKTQPNAGTVCAFFKACRVQESVVTLLMYSIIRVGQQHCVRNNDGAVFASRAHLNVNHFIQSEQRVGVLTNTLKYTLVE